MIARIRRRVHVHGRAAHALVCAVVTLTAICGASLLTWQRAAGHSPSFGASAHAATADSFASESFSPYLYRKNGQAADPVNLVFRTNNGEAVAKAVRTVLGWQLINSTPMDFRDADITRPTGWQFALPLNAGVRFHLRIEAVTRADRRGYVLAAVHQDLPSECGHLGMGFDAMREQVAQAFAKAGYRVETVTLGNTEAGRQCNGTFTAGDGRVTIIDLTRP